MSRSIHVTQKDLRRERKFAVHDNVPASPEMSVLDSGDIKKRIYKLNADWKGQANRNDTPVYAKLKLDQNQPESRVVRKFQSRKAKNNV